MSNQEYYPLKLPGSRLYPDNLEIRPFGRDEVVAYDRVRKSGSEIALRSLVGNTLKGISVDDLYEPDLLFIMLWHRVNSFMNFPMKLPWKCPICEADNSDNLDIAKIVSKEASFDYDPSGTTLDLPCGLAITLRLPKVGDTPNARKMLTALSILDINEEAINKAELVQLMEFDTNYNSLEKWEIVNKGFGVEDIFTIEGFKQEFSYGPTTVLKCVCAKCEDPQSVGFRFSVLEFLPNNYDGSTIRTRILPNRPTRDAAKRAKDALIPKVSMVAQTPPKENSRPQQRKSIDPPEPRSLAEEHKDQVTNVQKMTGIKSDQLAAKLMETARTEVEEEQGPSQMLPASEVVKGR